MAVYKVPQDVEAEDKLLGPFTFRQFIYLIIVAIGGFVAYMLGRIFIGLAIIPLPVMIFFLVLALPLRKDQPMELYLAAMVRFFLKPRMRMWIPDGSTALVEITAPRVIEELRTNGLSQDEARDRLSYLAQVMDSRGWASKGVAAPIAATIAPSDPLLTAGPSDAEDVLDDRATISRSFNTLLAQKDAQLKEQTRQRMHQIATAPAQSGSQPADSAAVPSDQKQEGSGPRFNPYPTMHQHIVPPIGTANATEPDGSPQATQTNQSASAPAARQTPEPSKTAEKPASTMTSQLPPDIINLANNTGLSISAIAHEAHRIEGVSDGDEVVVKLH